MLEVQAAWSRQGYSTTGPPYESRSLSSDKRCSDAALLSDAIATKDIGPMKMTPNAVPARRWMNHITAVAAVLMVSSLLVSACDEVTSTADDYVARAQEYRKKGDLKASIIEAKNALRVDPEKQEARYTLGLNYLDLGSWNFAEVMLEKAFEAKGVLEYAIMPALAEAKLALGKYDEVLEIAQVYEVMTSSLKAQIMIARGRALSGKSKPDEAEKLFNRALESDAKAFEAYLGLAGLALAGGDEEKGASLLQKADSIAPNALPVLQFKARNFYRMKDYENSSKEYRKLVEAHPTRVDFHLGLAGAQIAAGKFPEAIAMLDKMLKQAPNDPRTNYLRALAAFRTQNYEAAFTFSNKTLAVEKEHPPSLLIAGASAFARKQYEQAVQHLQQYIQINPNQTSARILLGELQLHMKRGKEALETLERAAKDRPENVDLLQKIALAATMTGDVQKSGDYFKKASELKPEDAQIKAALGMSKIALGDTKAGIEELEKAVDVDPNLPKAEVNLILYLLKEERYDEALKATERLQERHPNRATGFTIAGLTYFAMNKPDEAKASFRKALEVNPKAADAAANLAELEIRSGNPQKGAELLSEVLKNYPKHYRVLVKLGELEMRLGKPEASISLLQRAIEVQPTEYRPKLLLSQVLMLTGRFDKALLIAQSVPASYRQEPAMLEVMGQAQMATRKLDEALESFQSLVKAKPDSSQARYLLATAHIGMTDFQSGEAELKRALELDPKDIRAKNVLADVLLRQNKLDEAAKTIDELTAESKNRLYNLVLRGRLALGRGKSKEAVGVLTEANKLGQGTDLTLLLALAYAESGDQAKALQTMRNWLNTHPDDLQVRFRVATFHLGRKELQYARDEFAELVKRQPRNWLFLNNLAGVLNMTGEFADARAHAERAYKLAPSIPAVQDTYGVSLIGVGENGLAVRVLQSANEAAPQSVGIAYNLARALAKNGQVDEARSLLKNILAGGRPFPARKEAEGLLKTLGG